MLQPSPTTETSSSESPRREWVGRWWVRCTLLSSRSITASYPHPAYVACPRADARTSQAQPALHARAGRPARDRGPRRHRLPPRLRLGARRAARRRHLLHPLRLPDHRHPARAARPHAARSSLGRFWLGPRPAPAAGAVRDAADRRRLGDDLRPRPAATSSATASSPRRSSTSTTGSRSSATSPTSPASRPTGPLNHLWSLAVEEQFYIFWPFILLIGAQARPRDAAALRGAARGWRCATLRPGARLGDPDGGPLPPEPRPLAGLLRHRHPRLRAALRRRPGDGLAEPQAEPPDHPAGARTRSTPLGVARPADRSRS